MTNELPRRKNTRLPNYDYSQAGYYFVTICTHERKTRFSVGPTLCGRPSEADKLALYWLKETEKKYSQIRLDKYVLMPNHLHIIFQIQPSKETAGHAGPALQQVVGWYKTMTTNEWIREAKAGKLPRFQNHLWQDGYYDHIIRNEADYLRIWQYIDDNPAKWAEDEYYEE